MPRHTSIGTVFVLALVSIAFSAALLAQGAQHQAEVNRYREALAGQWMKSWMLSFSPRYIAIKDQAGFKDSLSPRFPTGMSYAAMRAELALDYTIDSRWHLGVRPTASLGYGYSAFNAHAEFPFESLSGRVPVRAEHKVDHVSFDLGAEFELRHDWAGFIVDYRYLADVRERRIDARDRRYFDSGGFVDFLDSKVREEEDIYQQHSWGLGIGFHMPDPIWNYRAALFVRPATIVDWKGRDASLLGLGLDLRADGLRLTDDVGLAIGFRWDYWFSDDEFSGVSFFEISIGVRFS